MSELNSHRFADKIRKHRSEIIQNFLTWLHKHWLILHPGRTENLIGRLNAAYDSGNDDLVGVIIAELTDKIKKL